jgi:dipeptide transport system substrate-binding protein
VLEQPGLNVGYLAYNTTKKPFDDVRVRKAINMAINKKAIIDAVYLTTGVAAKNPIPPTQWSYNDAIKDDPYDPAASKKLLADAGYPNGFATDLWAMPVQRPYNPNARRIAELIQADLAKVGVTAEIKSFEWGEYRKRMQAGEHQMGMLGWTGDNGDPDNFLATLLGCEAAKTGGSNVAKFCYQPYEDLVQRAKTISGQPQRTELYKQAQVIFKEQAPWFTIAHAVQLSRSARKSRLASLRTAQLLRVDIRSNLLRHHAHLRIVRDRRFEAAVDRQPGCATGFLILGCRRRASPPPGARRVVSWQRHRDATFRLPPCRRAEYRRCGRRFRA